MHAFQSKVLLLGPPFLCDPYYMEHYKSIVFHIFITALEPSQVRTYSIRILQIVRLRADGMHVRCAVRN